MLNFWFILKRAFTFLFFEPLSNFNLVRKLFQVSHTYSIFWGGKQVFVYFSWDFSRMSSQQMTEEKTLSEFCAMFKCLNMRYRRRSFLSCKPLSSYMRPRTRFKWEFSRKNSFARRLHLSSCLNEMKRHCRITYKFNERIFVVFHHNSFSVEGFEDEWMYLMWRQQAVKKDSLLTSLVLFKIGDSTSQNTFDHTPWLASSIFMALDTPKNWLA